VEEVSWRGRLLAEEDLTFREVKAREVGKRRAKARRVVRVEGA